VTYLLRGARDDWTAMEAAGMGDERSQLTDDGRGALFDDWYRAQYPRVVRVLAVVGGDLEVASDAAAEAFARALAQWDRVSAMASPSGWTYTVALNLLRRRQRRARLEHLVGLLPPPPPPVAEDHLFLWAAVRSLPPRQRTAIVLHYVGDLPQDQVAKIMGVALGTVAATLHAARSKLRALLDDQDNDGMTTHD
jgi:DNA-directed RNA polymerase specialized sigma24 family protein